MNWTHTTAPAGAVPATPGYQAVIYILEKDRPEADQLQIVDYTTVPVVAWLISTDGDNALGTPVLPGQLNDFWSGAVVYPDGRVGDSKRFYKNLTHYKAKHGVRASQRGGHE